MKATGIVRRIDDLGRIVIPKEIRRTMRIREGDPMEIFTNREGEIMLKKYSPVGELAEFAGTLAESLAQTSGDLVCITDRDFVIASAGNGKKNYEGKALDEQLQAFIDRRGNVTEAGDGKNFVKVTPDDEKEYLGQAAATILCHGDCIGSVIIYTQKKEKEQLVGIAALSKTAANFLGKHMEQ
uniref:stage V sporulation T C-terminal domain-containing protein n=1 Tax=Agathobacter sp. TaxID=2021311 RepID=UPI004055C4BB